LPSEDPTLLADAHRELGWLNDDSRYRAVPVRGAAGCPKPRHFPYEHVLRLAELDIIRPVDARDVRGHVHMFLVPEFHKERLRPIKHTEEANRVLDTVSEMHFPSKQYICDLVHKGDCFVSLDFAAYYDQFSYSLDVGSRFCFQAGGRHWALSSLAMGQRQAVQVAMATTWQLLNFARRSTTAVVIDNIIFVGSKDDVLHDAREFVARCNEAHAKLNEDTSDLEALVATSGEWCGIHLDMTAKTVKLTKKSVDRTRESWRRRDHWTWRGFAAHVGMLFWSWGIIDAPVCEFFGLLAFISKTSRMLTERPDAWDEMARIPPSAVAPMQRWTDIVFANTERHVPIKAAPEWTVCTDASAWGWGYCALNNVTGEVRTHGAPWTWHMRSKHGDKLGQSTFAEPHGITNSLLHLLPGDSGCTVHVGTDNTAARWAFDRQFSSHSLGINEAIARLRRLLPRIQVSYAHVAGATNVADRVSRGGVYGEAELADVATSLRQERDKREKGEVQES
jgi:hypothetical protein